MNIVLRRPVVTIAAVLAVIAAFLGIRAAPAHAATNGFCVQENTYNQCLNDWNNGGPSNSSNIRLYPLNNPNENFAEQQLPGRCGGNVNPATSCPFSNKYFDNYYSGWPIVQLKYGSTNYCLSTGSAADGTASTGVLGYCNGTASGSGGSIGTVFVDHNGYMINVYWTNQGQYGDNAACMEPEGGTGTSSFVYLDLPTGDGCALWSSD
jgi:hypothetical protein